MSYYRRNKQFNPFCVRFSLNYTKNLAALEVKIISFIVTGEIKVIDRQKSREYNSRGKTLKYKKLANEFEQVLVLIGLTSDKF